MFVLNLPQFDPIVCDVFVIEMNKFGNSSFIFVISCYSYFLLVTIQIFLAKINELKNRNCQGVNAISSALIRHELTPLRTRALGTIKFIAVTDRQWLYIMCYVSLLNIVCFFFCFKTRLSSLPTLVCKGKSHETHLQSSQR